MRRSRVSSAISDPCRKRVQHKRKALGGPGLQWMDDLGRIVTEIEREWRIEVGRALVGGSGGYVAEAVTEDGVDAVLKLSIPDGLDGHTVWADEVATLRLGQGHGYVRVLKTDANRRAMLQERLGRPLSELDLPVETQIKILARTLQNGWYRPANVESMRTGREQAQDLAIDFEVRWERLGHPCPRPTIDRAIAFTDARIAAYDAERAVFVHGDAHPANVLESVRGGGADGPFSLIDPDGMLSEPAHDLAIPLRDWTEELLAGDLIPLALEWCAQLSALTGVESRAIWEWAFIERVSTGLFLMDLGDPLGDPFLEVASRLTGTAP